MRNEEISLRTKRQLAGALKKLMNKKPFDKITVKELLAECRLLGGCKTGQAKITKGYNLKAKYIIHTVGPVYHSRADDADMLASCYKNSMELAVNNDIHSIAFPAISTGIYGYPKDKACAVAVKTINQWVNEHKGYDIDIYFVCFDNETYDSYKGMI